MSEAKTVAERTVRDILGEADLACRCDEAYSGRGLEDPQCPAHAVEWFVQELGIDPAMPIETLRRRLAWGTRYDELVEQHGANRVGMWAPAPPEDPALAW